MQCWILFNSVAPHQMMLLSSRLQPSVICLPQLQILCLAVLVPQFITTLKSGYQGSYQPQDNDWASWSRVPPQIRMMNRLSLFELALFSDQVIVLDTDIAFATDIGELWKLFQKFKQKEVSTIDSHLKCWQHHRSNISFFMLAEYDK